MTVTCQQPSVAKWQVLPKEDAIKVMVDLESQPDWIEKLLEEQSSCLDVSCLGELCRHLWPSQQFHPFVDSRFD